MRTKLFFYIVFSMFFMGCSNDKQHISLYTINMQYACECPQYRVFKIEDKSQSSPFKDKQHIDIETLNNEIEYALNIANRDDNSISSTDENSLIGWDIDLLFENKEIERDFIANEGISPICNIYYLEGYLQKTLLNTPILLVKNFKIFSKDSKCASSGVVNTQDNNEIKIHK